jgi:hypothetical protein
MAQNFAANGFLDVQSSVVNNNSRHDLKPEPVQLRKTSINDPNAVTI